MPDLTPDSRNANKGTERGLGMLEHSLRNLGAGRSILVDKEGRVIAGNKTLERATDLGIPVEIIQTDGKRLIAVQRTDLDLDTDPKARELAYADNRIAEVDLDWDIEQMKADIEAGVDLGEFWLEDELRNMLSDAEFSEPITPDIDWAADSERARIVIVCNRPDVSRVRESLRALELQFDGLSVKQ